MSWWRQDILRFITVRLPNVRACGRTPRLGQLGNQPAVPDSLHAPGNALQGGCVGMQATKPPRQGNPAGLDRAAAVYCPGKTRVPDPINFRTPDDVAPRSPSVATRGLPVTAVRFEPETGESFYRRLKRRADAYF